MDIGGFSVLICFSRSMNVEILSPSSINFHNHGFPLGIYLELILSYLSYGKGFYDTKQEECGMYDKNEVEVRPDRIVMPKSSRKKWVL